MKVVEGENTVVSRSKYEELLALKGMREFTPTIAQKRALAQAENNFRRGETLSYDELVQKLGFTR